MWIDRHFIFYDSFAASMRNHIKWETIDAEHVLDVDVELNILLEVVTLLNFLLSSRFISFSEMVIS